MENALKQDTLVIHIVSDLASDHEDILGQEDDQHDQRGHSESNWEAKTFMVSVVATSDHDVDSDSFDTPHIGHVSTIDAEQ